jgi:hypothetical protein
MVRKRKGAGEVGRTEKYQNGRKRKGAEDVGRTETIQNGPFVQSFVQIKL